MDKEKDNQMLEEIATRIYDFGFMSTATEYFLRELSFRWLTEREKM
jgi:hypothetical protein